jgi:hypothetical protein
MTSMAFTYGLRLLYRAYATTGTTETIGAVSTLVLGCPCLWPLHRSKVSCPILYDLDDIHLLELLLDMVMEVLSAGYCGAVGH